MRPLRGKNDGWVGLDCTRGVGQDLNALVFHGYLVCHDFPGEKSSIDHIAVGPNGVFSVAAGSRAELKRGKGHARAIYSDQNLGFPLWVETRCLDEARKQAQWLSRWLGGTVGAAVMVYPLVVLPGWLVNRGKWGDVVLVRERDYQFLTTPRARLSDSLIERIGHELKQRCGDVEPAAMRAGRI
jgi:hypothetical protein